MKKLNKQATRIFLQLLEKLGTRDHLRVHVEGFMPISLEKIAPVDTSHGKGYIYSLAHTYVQSGDLMYDPEMCFIVVEDPNTPADLDLVGIFPGSYRQDSLAIDAESITIRDGSIANCIPRLQADHCRFANLWMRNIKMQGFLK